MTICDIHAYPLFFLSSPVTSHGIHCMSVFSWRRSRQQDVDVRTQMASEHGTQSSHLWKYLIPTTSNGHECDRFKKIALNEEIIFTILMTHCLCLKLLMDCMNITYVLNNCTQYTLTSMTSLPICWHVLQIFVQTSAVRLSYLGLCVCVCISGSWIYLLFPLMVS